MSERGQFLVKDLLAAAAGSCMERRYCFTVNMMVLEFCPLMRT